MKIMMALQKSSKTTVSVPNSLRCRVLT